MLQDIFSVIEDSDGSERPLSLSNIHDYFNILCGRDVGNLVKKPCGFLSKAEVYQKQSWWVNHLVPEFTAQPTDCELSPYDVNVLLGIYWGKLRCFSICAW